MCMCMCMWHHACRYTPPVQARLCTIVCSFQNLAKNGALEKRFGGGNIKVSE